ncbi:MULTISPECIES: DUF1993 domain-containing protein [unclassified Ensifer]|uniref:DUF1993 domain-containing protein n=1 Tax=unclassified Ensifer TaxID=2633371 RepID=UPI00081355B6|nr:MULTISPECIES: DUF1993 domain-containing protein [unclassified Ensifer]OCP09171.1 hypothetical protein BC374_00895 [Ensifer sp. LC13]OCP10357.1 hypothetical protein BBX50_01245 [Ensifer sp. LC11]OCP14040.1 hypothetical protein BC362_04710 [Ensifer sp. LC14]OCP32417.1 hypothetical protein BC364_00895 [Ensifer sp. LC499]
MALTMYQLSIPAFIRGLGVLSKLLDKAEAFAREKDISADDVVNARLAPDMLTLAGQVQRVSDTSKGLVGRLTSLEVPRFPDEEKTLDELRQRIANTIAFLETVEPADLEDSDRREVVLNFPTLKVTLTGEEYLQKFVLPNFYFHLTTAYDILRHEGAPVGKADFLSFA